MPCRTLNIPGQGVVAHATHVEPNTDFCPLHVADATRRADVSPETPGT